MKKIIGGVKDENGIFTKNPTPPIVQDVVTITDISIDHLMREVLTNIAGIIRAVKLDVGTGMPSRESVQNLKDCQAMLKDLRKDEQDYLDALSDEELKNL